jgi:hypothetical protein
MATDSGLRPAPAVSHEPGWSLDKLESDSSPLFASRDALQVIDEVAEALGPIVEDLDLPIDELGNVTIGDLAGDPFRYLLERPRLLVRFLAVASRVMPSAERRERHDIDPFDVAVWKGSHDEDTRARLSVAFWQELTTLRERVLPLVPPEQIPMPTASVEALSVPAAMLRAFDKAGEVGFAGWGDVSIAVGRSRVTAGGKQEGDHYVRRVGAGFLAAGFLAWVPEEPVGRHLAITDKGREQLRSRAKQNW